jgi:hypothetical protein
MCYERVDSKLWASIFALCLAAACSTHFYAALSFFPFGLAELTYTATKRKFRPQVWIGFVVGVVPYFFFWPILNEQRLLGAHFWSPATFWIFAQSLGELLHLAPGFTFVIFASLSIYVVGLIYAEYRKERPASPSGVGFSLPDLALTLGFLTIPFVTYALTKIGGGGLRGRYMVTATLGICLVLSQILSRLKRPTILFAGILILCMFAFQEGVHWRFVLWPREVKDPMQVPWQLGENMNLPLVVSSHVAFLPAWHRASDTVKSHLFNLADPQIELQATGNDSGALNMLGVATYFPVNAQTFSEFAPVHRNFLLYSDGDPDDYWPRWLAGQGYSLRVINVESPSVGEAVDAPGPPKGILYYVDLDSRK